MAVKVPSSELRAWADANPSWAAGPSELSRDFAFAAYRDGVAFAVAVALHAERIDHHPEIGIAWGRVRVVWSTHDVGGTSDLDLAAALATDAIAARHGAQASTHPGCSAEPS
jgi:4a-hydroxytetrahydrobiopterin dehydratase